MPAVHTCREPFDRDWYTHAVNQKCGCFFVFMLLATIFFVKTPYKNSSPRIKYFYHSLDLILSLTLSSCKGASVFMLTLAYIARRSEAFWLRPEIHTGNTRRGEGTIYTLALGLSRGFIKIFMVFTMQLLLTIISLFTCCCFYLKHWFLSTFILLFT